jgi:hypothetical protein
MVDDVDGAVSHIEIHTNVMIDSITNVPPSLATIMFLPEQRCTEYQEGIYW